MAQVNSHVSKKCTLMNPDYGLSQSLNMTQVNSNDIKVSDNIVRVIVSQSLNTAQVHLEHLR